MSRRALRAVIAVAAAGSLLGVQAVTSSASASTPPVVWRPGQPAPSGTGFWSNACPSGSGQSATGIPNDSSNLHNKLADDQNSVAATLTMAAENGADVGWQYSPTAGNEGGPSFVLPSPTTTASITAQVQGTISGQAMAYYQANNVSDYYMGIAQLNSTGTAWGAVTATTFKWYHWTSGVLGSAWSPVFTSFGSSAPVTIADLANGKNDTGKTLPAGSWYAAIELGCGTTGPTPGTFAIDHIQINDGNSAEYDLQNPSTSTTTAGQTTVAPGKSATITSSVISGSTLVTEGTTTLWSTTDGTTWNPGPTSGAGGRAFTVYPTQNTQYKVFFNGTTNYAATSPADGVAEVPATVNVAPKLGLRADRSIMNVKTAATFTATFAPARTGVPVTFQQKVATGWQTIGTASTNSSGVATFRAVRAAAGLWTVRTTAPTQPGLLATNAPATSIKVYQPVTIPISTSPRTLYVGNSIRISGVLTQRLGGVPLLLQQRVGGRWVTYARGKTGVHGGYAFTRRANSIGTATFRVIAPAAGYRRAGTSAPSSVRIIRRPPPPPVYVPPPSGGGGTGSGGGGTGSGGGSTGGGGNGIG